MNIDDKMTDTTGLVEGVFGGRRSRTSIWRDIRSGALPEPLKIGGKNYWVIREVIEHIRGTAVKSVEGSRGRIL